MVGTTSLAGCGFINECGRVADFELDRATDRELVQRASTPVQGSRLGPLGTRIARTAIDRGATTYRAGDVLVEDGVYRHDDTFYRLTTAEKATTSVRGYRVDVTFDYRPSETLTDSKTTIAFEELPRSDRRVLMRAFLNDIAKRAEGRGPTGRGEGMATLRYSKSAQQSSVLVPDPQYEAIIYDNTTIRIFVTEEMVDTTLHTFEVQADRIADSREQLAQFVIQNRFDGGVNLDQRSLTAEQRAILDEAISTGYTPCIERDVPSAFARLVRTIYNLNLDAGHSLMTQTQLIIYDETPYIATLNISVG